MPVALAVVPASIVATLFTASAIDMAALIVSPRGGTTLGWETLAILPFWLWGPLLGLATWGYAMARADRAH